MNLALQLLKLCDKIVLKLCSSDFTVLCSVLWVLFSGFWVLGSYSFTDLQTLLFNVETRLMARFLENFLGHIPRFDEFFVAFSSYFQRRKNTFYLRVTPKVHELQLFSKETNYSILGHKHNLKV